MAIKQYDYVVFIGRFQPFHIGHLFVLQKALSYANHLIVLIGSSDGSRNLNNPFSYAERLNMINKSLPKEMKNCITFMPLQDYTYNDNAWVKAVSTLVTKCITANSKKNIALIGHNKDKTTYYLKLFPQWHYIEIKNIKGINATDIRKCYFAKKSPIKFNSNKLPAQINTWLQKFSNSKEFSYLIKEYQAIKCFQSKWTKRPIIFTATNALITYKNKILLLKRNNHPGKGLLSLPGDFLKKRETLLECCLRQITINTQLKINEYVLKKSIISHEIFDYPKRSCRGRIISHCYYFDLSHLSLRPQTKISIDDNDKPTILWHNIGDIDRNYFFEDHFFIINKLLKKI